MVHHRQHFDYCNTDRAVGCVYSNNHYTLTLITLANLGGEWSSNKPVWCARYWGVKCLLAWLMLSISSPKPTDDPFDLRLITCARWHVRTTALETSFGDASPRIWNSLPRCLRTMDISYKHFKHYWRHVWLGHCALWLFYISALEMLLLAYTDRRAIAYNALGSLCHSRAGVNGLLSVICPQFTIDIG